MQSGLVDFSIEVVYIVLSILLLFCAKITLNLLTPFRVDDEVSAKDNPAFGLSLIGYYLGVMIIFIGATLTFNADSAQSSDFPWQSVLADFAWCLLGVVLLNAARMAADKVVFKTFSTRKEIITDRNVGMGAVEFGVYVGSALILAGAISGRGGGLHTALAFFALGQLGLFVVSWLYQLITRYDFHDEIEKDNAAAGVAFGGNCIAVGIVLMRGTAGDFVSWPHNLIQFGWYFCCAVILMFIGRVSIDRVLLPSRTLQEEIVEDRNVNAGFLEGGLMIGLAAVVGAIL